MVQVTYDVTYYDVIIVNWFVILYLSGQFFTIYLCQFELLEVLLSK